MWSNLHDPYFFLQITTTTPYPKKLENHAPIITYKFFPIIYEFGTQKWVKAYYKALCSTYADVDGMEFYSIIVYGINMIWFHNIVCQ